MPYSTDFFGDGHLLLKEQLGRRSFHPHHFGHLTSAIRTAYLLRVTLIFYWPFCFFNLLRSVREMNLCGGSNNSPDWNACCKMIKQSRYRLLLSLKEKSGKVWPNIVRSSMPLNTMKLLEYLADITCGPAANLSRSCTNTNLKALSVAVPLPKYKVSPGVMVCSLYKKVSFR